MARCFLVGICSSSARSALPPLEVLYKLRKQRPDVFDKLEGQSLSLTSSRASYDLIEENLQYTSMVA